MLQMIESSAYVNDDDAAGCKQHGLAAHADFGRTAAPNVSPAYS